MSKTKPILEEWAEVAKKARSAIPQGGNDNVNTPDDLALAIVEHFAPIGSLCDPCAGGGAFERAFDTYATRHPGRVQGVTAFDIADGHDFLAVDTEKQAPWNWIITNEPWSLFLAFLRQGMKTADNIVFLDKLNAWAVSARIKAMKAAGWEFREIALVAQPPKPWPQMGLQFAAVHIARAATPGNLGRPAFTEVAWTPPAKAPRIKTKK